MFKKYLTEYFKIIEFKRAENKYETIQIHLGKLMHKKKDSTLFKKDFDRWKNEIESRNKKMTNKIINYFKKIDKNDTDNWGKLLIQKYIFQMVINDFNRLKDKRNKKINKSKKIQVKPHYTGTKLSNKLFEFVFRTLCYISRYS